MKIKNLTTELLVENMKESLQFYTELLGFSVIVTVPETKPFFVILSNGPVQLMLYQREQFTEEIPDFHNQKMGGTIALYFEVEEVDSLYKKLKPKVKLIQDLHSTNYGSTEFSFSDNSGYVIMVAERKAE